MSQPPILSNDMTHILETTSHTVANLQPPIINVVHQPIIQSAELAEGPGEYHRTGANNSQPLYDNWDTMAQNVGTDILNVYDSSLTVGKSSSKLKILLPLLLVVTAAIIYFMFPIEQFSVVQSGLENAKKYLTVANKISEQSVKNTLPQKPNISSKVAATIANVPTEFNDKFEKKLPPNLSDRNSPYGLLPNFVIAQAKPPKPQWSLKEEEDLKIKMKHQYFYQRYQAIEKVRRERFFGSQELLRDALNQPHLWIKANSLIGLADADMSTSEAEIKKVFFGVRKATLANYLKRYEKKSLTAGEMYFMRLSLQYGHPAARLQALKNILISQDELSGIYINAAQRDEDPKITKWFENSDAILRSKKFLGLIDEAVELNRALKYQRTWKYSAVKDSSPSPKVEIQNAKAQPVVTFYEVKE